MSTIIVTANSVMISNGDAITLVTVGTLTTSNTVNTSSNAYNSYITVIPSNNVVSNTQMQTYVANAISSYSAGDAASDLALVADLDGGVF